MSNLVVVRNAMAAQISKYTVPALRTLAEPMDVINPPVGIVLPARNYVRYGTTLDGATGFGPVLGPAATTPLAPTDFNLDFLIILSKASTLERVEANLDAWLGMQSDGTTVSVPAAIMADPTLGGTVAWCIPVSADGPGPLEYNGAPAFACRMHFELSAI